MYHNDELNYVQTLWTVGYIIGQIPSNILLTRIRPSIWLPCSEVRFSCGSNADISGWQMADGRWQMAADCRM